MRFVGAERIPRTGPVILVLNHGNDLPDALVGFAVSPRDVCYVATISAANSTFAQWIYRGLGIVPVSRIKDVRRQQALGTDVAALNAGALVRVSAELANNGVIGIFPEGGVSNTPHLGHFKAGLAKMALYARDDVAIKRIQIVPVGIQYEAPESVRSDLVVVVGDPIDLDCWQPTGPETLHKSLTRHVATALSDVTRNAPTMELLSSLNRLLAAVSAVDRSVGDAPLAAAERARRQLPRAGIKAEAGETAAAESRRLADCRHLLDLAAERQGRWVAKAGGRTESARDHLVVAVTGGATSEPDLETHRARTLYLSPVALLGWLIHGLPFALLLVLADRLAVAPSERAAKAILPGLYLVLGWYLIVAIVAVAVGGWPWLLLIAVLPRLGDAAVTWRDDLIAWRLRQRVRQWTSDERASLRANFEELRQRWREYLSLLGELRERPHINTSVVPVSPPATNAGTSP